MKIETIIQKCFKNDRQAQKLLYHRYKDRLISIAYRYDNDINTAKDILQNTFIKIFKNLDSFNSEKGSFEQWITRILINEALMHKRKNKNFISNDSLDVFEKYINIDHLDQITIEELRIIIEKLPEVHRVILNLYYFEEYTHKEIASILGIKESSSRSQLSKSRRILKLKWDKNNLIATK